MPGLPDQRDLLPTDNSSFKYVDLKVELTKAPRPKKPPQELLFGREFTDHMFICEYVEGEGWGTPTIQPFGNISLHPAATVLHYGMCCFEGMKAYMGSDARPRLFRPDMNMARLRRSVRRLELADFDPKELLECLKELLRVDRSWLPPHPGYSLYIRPFAFSSTHALGIHKAERTTICITLCPVGPYFVTGMQPVSLFLDEQHVRAWPGGSGDAKVGGNYAPTIGPQVAAAKTHGTPQVLYTLPMGPDPNSALISECGAMNLMVYLEKEDGTRELATPPLDGTILPGVTRDSMLTIASGWGEFAVVERPITVGELARASASGRLMEIFGCGTACLVQPVQELVRAGSPSIVPSHDYSSPKSLSGRLLAELTAIQHADKPSDWSVPV